MADVNGMSLEQLQARIAELERKNKRLATAGQGKLQIKVAEKGGVKLQGLGRFPTTLYYSQWIRVLDFFGCPEDNVNRMQIEEWKEEGLLKLKGEDAE